MKIHFPVWFVFVLLFSCSPTNKIARGSFQQALIGQNEMKIFSMLGPPKSILPASGGGKVMVYEHYTKGMFLTPNKSKVTYSHRRDISGNREGLTFHGGLNTVTNDPAYTIYQKEVSCLKIYLDKNGICVSYEENLPHAVPEIYHERFKHFTPEIR